MNRILNRNKNNIILYRVLINRWPTHGCLMRRHCGRWRQIVHVRIVTAVVLVMMRRRVMVVRMVMMRLVMMVMR